MVDYVEVNSLRKFLNREEGAGGTPAKENNLLGNKNKVHPKANRKSSGVSAKELARVQHIGLYTRGHLDKLCAAIWSND
jgi:hypothetical protein